MEPHGDSAFGDFANKVIANLSDSMEPPQLSDTPAVPEARHLTESCATPTVAQVTDNSKPANQQASTNGPFKQTSGESDIQTSNLKSNSSKNGSKARETLIT